MKEIAKDKNKMATNSNTLITMGVISDKVYNTTKGKDYFKNNPDDIIANNHTYKVLEHTSAQERGFHALLLQEKNTNKYVIAFRGTAEHVDIFDDALVGLKNDSLAFTQAKAFVSDMLKKHQIDKENLTLTGDSLGGILTQAVGAAYEIEGVAFNPYGVDRLLSMPPLDSPLADTTEGVLHTAAYKVGTLFGLEAPQTAWAHAHITNVHYVDKADPLSNVATELSSKYLGNSLLVQGENKGMDKESMPLLNKTLAQQNQLLKHFKGATLASLNRLYSVTGYDKAQEIFKTLEVEKSSPRSLRLESLHDKEIEEYDLQDPATIYALEHLNPFVVEGNLDAYKEIDIDNYSKEQLADRVAFYYDKMHEVSDKETMSHEREDRPNSDSHADSGIDKAAFGNQEHHTSHDSSDDDLYGHEGNDIIDARGHYDNTLDNDQQEGGKGMDTLYNGKGDDTLIGGYGGGKDDHTIDVLYGAEGFDTYYVNDKDIISESDNVGRIVFNGNSLSGEKQKIEEHRYIDSHFNYDYSPEDKRLTVVDRATQAKITIEQFDPSSDALGIVLDASQLIPKPKEIERPIQTPHHTTPAIQPLEEDETYAQVDLNRVTPITLSTLIANLPPSFVAQAEIEIQEGDVVYYKGKQEALVEKGDTLQDVLEYTKLNTTKLLACNPWLISKERVSFSEGSHIVETPKENLSIADTLIYEEALADKIYANTVTEDELGIQREDETSQNQTIQER